MGIYGPAWFPDLPGAFFCLAGLVAQFFVFRRLGVSKKLNLLSVLTVFTVFVYCARPHKVIRSAFDYEVLQILPAVIQILNMGFLLAWVLTLLLARIPGFRADRRRFLRRSAVAACAIPGAVLGAGILTRKDFHINEVRILFRNLPPGLEGLRLVQISDIHMSAFFSRHDLRRVVDACNGLAADLVMVTGDLITTWRDPLDDCLLELKQLRSASGVWGCMGNHEAYARCQTYLRRKAHLMGIDFLRYEHRALRFGESKLNLMGVDHQFNRNVLYGVETLHEPDAFNLLLSHTPAIFPLAAEKNIDLTLSGHTHGGQLNLEIAGTNINVVDLVTPYTKGLYRQGDSAVYVNSGLGTIAIPMRIGAPPEISVIQLCRS